MTPADSRIQNGAEIIMSDFRRNSKAVMSGNPNIAAKTLTKAINKYKFSREALMAVKINRVCVAKDFSWRAWCNWRMAKDNYDELTVQIRLKLLDYVLSDCGFVTGMLLINLLVSFYIKVINILIIKFKKLDFSRMY
jgi:hypothetical protein